MFYSKVVNLPTANTAYLIRTLLLALDPTAPLTLTSPFIKAVSSNSGQVAVGGSGMTSVLDGNELGATDSMYEPSEEGINLDTSSRYLIADTDNQKVLIQGHLY